MKVKGPLFSWKAKGSFDCITFKDVNLEGNKHMTVAHLKNKRKKQVTCQNNKEAIAAAVSLWQELTEKEKESWELVEYKDDFRSQQKQWQAELSGYHKMIGVNVKRYLKGEEMVRVYN